MRALLVPLGVMVALAAWPPGPLQQNPNLRADMDAGYCVREVRQYTAFLPPWLQQRLADAGYPITPTAVPYKRLRGRAFSCAWPDGGSALLLPRLAQAAEYFRPDLTSLVTPCDAGDAGTLCPANDDGADDGGSDALEEVPFECGCSTGASCTLSDGGAAPTGLTLNPGDFSGTGCRRKTCAQLFRLRADGGLEHSFPPACPTP